jgi:hypothetical protein
MPYFPVFCVKPDPLFGRVQLEEQIKQQARGQPEGDTEVYESDLRALKADYSKLATQLHALQVWHNGVMKRCAG